MNLKKSVIADTIHGNIELTDFEKKIISHVTFNRLHDVYQNSTVYLTFPCNRTKRFEHSLGTMKLCSDMFINAVNNSDKTVCENFLKFYTEQLKKILSSIVNLKFKTYESVLGGRVRKIKLNELPQVGQSVFSYFSNEVHKYYTTYFILTQAIRISALLHDIGHPPYSHVTEFALEKIRNEYKNSTATERIIEYNNIMNSFFEEDKKKLHEKMGDTIVKIILEDSIDSISESQANRDTDLFNDQIIKILVKEVVEKILLNDISFISLHRIIDGTLDGDRLDYVTRDALNSGLDKGKIEYDRLCSSMIVVEHKKEFWICPSIKLLNTVEDYLNRRWSIYKNIIYHHRVIKTDYLLQSVIEQISREYLCGSLEGENEDRSINLLPSDISGLWKALRASANVDSSYAISQWDDAWLITVLKKHYFQDYIENCENIKLTKQLQELLTNKKQYFSLIKRLEDFLVIDNAISNQLKIYGEELIPKIKKLKDYSKEYNGDDSEIVNIDPFLKSVEKILELSKIIDENETFQGLIFSHLKKSFHLLYNNTETLDLFLNDIIQNSKEYFLKNTVEDVFIVVKNYDIGLKKPLLLYDESQKKVVSIHEVSSIAKVLDLSYDTFPQFFIYVLKTEEYKEKYIDVNNFLEKIGIEIATKFYKKWLELLEENIKKYALKLKEGVSL